MTTESKQAPIEAIPTCGICAEPYTTVLRKRIECASCHKDLCTKCIERYLLSTIEDPHCVYCRAAWPRPFLSTACTNTFLNKTYYAHRQTILVNREKSFLPNYQLAAERTLRIRALSKEDAVILDELAKVEARHRQEIAVISNQRTAVWRRINRVRRGLPETGSDTEEPTRAVATKFVRRCTATGCNGFLSSAWKCGLCYTWVCPDCFEVKGPEKDAPHTCTPEMLQTAALIRKDTKPCPSCGEMISKIDGCFAADTPVLGWNGQVVLAKDIKVGDVLIGDDGTPRTVQSTCTGEDEMFTVYQRTAMSYTVNSKHTLVLLAADRKIVEIPVDAYLRLPVKEQITYLGIAKGYEKGVPLTVLPIGKGTYYGWSVDGNKRFCLKDNTICRNCDQMFCTTCHNPFSWITGQSIKTGVIHNPHYFQWLAKGGQPNPTNPGHVPCGGLPNPYRVQRALANATKEDRKVFLEILRICSHIGDIERPRYERHLNPVNNEDVGVRYLLKETDEDGWKSILGKQEKDRQKSNEIRDILDAFYGAAIDLFRRIDVDRTEGAYTKDEATALIMEISFELGALRRFIFQSMTDVSKSFHCSVPLISEDWCLEHGLPSNLARKKRLAEEEKQKEKDKEKEKLATAVAAVAVALEAQP